MGAKASRQKATNRLRSCAQRWVKRTPQMDFPQVYRALSPPDGKHDRADNAYFRTRYYNLG